MTEIRVGVRELAAFCHREGDIDYRFTPSPTGEEGSEGHRRLYRRRPESYLREYAVSHRRACGGFELVLQGRADGYDPEQGMVEEIKTCRVPMASIPAAVSRRHLAQARLYAALVAAERELEELEVHLTWFNIDTGEEQSLSQHYSSDELAAFLDESLRRFADWQRLLLEHRQARTRSIAQLHFPHGEFRPGQRDIAELAYKCVDRGGQLMLEAPTGIGKTAAVLYPALKALERDKHDALVFVTFRTVGRRAAEQCLAQMRAAGLRAGSLSLTAREQVCLSPGSACHGDDCPYARGYYDRLPAARAAALEVGALHREAVEALAREHRVCPYQLAEDLLPWVDIAIADAHYVFALGSGLTGDGRRWSVLLDEAHNLPERARALYSARLEKHALMQAKRTAPAPLRRALAAVNDAMLDLQRELGPGGCEAERGASRAELPEALCASLADFTAALGSVRAGDPGLGPRHPELVQFYFDALHWLRVADCWGDEYRFELARGSGRQSLVLTLNCLDPSRLLGEAHSRAHALLAFSATLSPAHWMRRGMGFADSAVWRRLDSPFEAGQLKVEVETGIDTRYRSRQASLPALARRILSWWRERPGNCIVYFPSYQYLRDCLALARELDPALAGRSLWEQRPGLDTRGRQELFDLLDARRDVAACCILGGIYGEGIDLPGELLSSVVVVGVGLPQVGREREVIREWYESRGAAGFDYAYRYPGMQRVAQALGRVVRGVEDRGGALLVDPRYASTDWRELLPPWWDYQRKSNP